MTSSGETAAPRDRFSAKPAPIAWSAATLATICPVARSRDTLTGGAGKDHFVFDTALATAGVDRITDFRHLTDKIDLSHAIFTATNASGTLQAAMFFEGRHAHDASDRIVYNPVSGWLTYDSNGSAAGGTHHFATLAAHLTLTHGDFLVAP